MGSELVELELVGVRRQTTAEQVVILLLDMAGRRLLPVVVGPSEGAAIAAGQAGIEPERPMTHDLLVSVLSTVGSEVCSVEIVALVDGVFHAELVLSGGARVDARASDAVAIAVRIGCPVLCHDEVLEESALAVEEPGTSEDEVAEFREFLETVTPQDFENAPESGPKEDPPES
jgi:uncharacterized protein